MYVVPLYFAYGSNMHRKRLVERVGAVRDHGHALLGRYRHEFAKRGQDGTGKGTLRRDNCAVVHGVVYSLSDSQFLLLAKIEGGYAAGPVELPGTRAQTFFAERPASGLAPTREYLAHYVAGMKEHGFPEEYVRFILEQATL